MLIFELSDTSAGKLYDFGLVNCGQVVRGEEKPPDRDGFLPINMLFLNLNLRSVVLSFF